MSSGGSTHLTPGAGRHDTWQIPPVNMFVAYHLVSFKRSNTSGDSYMSISSEFVRKDS